MATRNMTLVVDRKHAEEFEKGFAVKPQLVSDKAYVHMYLHHDGYPEWRGVELANWIQHMQDDRGFKNFGDGSRIASHLVHDFHYNSQYLYPNVDCIDHEYTWIIWTGKSDVWLSAYNQYTNTCEFVGGAQKLLDKYKNKQYGYTDWNEKHKVNTIENG
jgi:hypothetical protein